MPASAVPSCSPLADHVACGFRLAVLQFTQQSFFAEELPPAVHADCLGQPVGVEQQRRTLREVDVLFLVVVVLDAHGLVDFGVEEVAGAVVLHQHRRVVGGITV